MRSRGLERDALLAAGADPCRHLGCVAAPTAVIQGRVTDLTDRRFPAGPLGPRRAEPADATGRHPPPVSEPQPR
jgi:hypothetical protein